MYFFYAVIFGGVCCLHIQGGRVKLAGNLLATCRVMSLPLNLYSRPTRAAYCSNLKIDEKYSSETLIGVKQTTRCHFPEGYKNLNRGLKFGKTYVVLFPCKFMTF